jgi:glycosyltransferase involved in cell wall biosynthesis
MEDEKTTPRTLWNFVREWEKAGHKVDVIKPNFILNSFLRGKPFYKTGQYGEVYNVNYWLPFIKVTQPSTLNPQLTIAHMPSGILYADKLGLPFVAGIHNSDLQVLTKYPYFRGRMLKALRNARAIACRSPVIKNKLLALYPEFEKKTFTAPSGIPPLPNVGEGRGEGVIKILTAAHDKKRKNIDKVIKACKDLEGFELTVIKGGVAREKVLEIMRESDIFILPSVHETFGMVYLEAMASGCITVCTKNDGIDGIIKDGENGFTVEPTVQAVRELLLKIKNTAPQTLAAIRQRSLETVKDYTPEKCAENYLHYSMFLLR